MGTLLAATVSHFYQHRAQRLGAALAFYTIFALAPSLILILVVAGFFLGESAAQGRIVEEISGLIGKPEAEVVEAVLLSAHEQSLGISGLVITLIPLVLGLWGVFGELQDALNTIWGVRPKPRPTLLEIVKERFWTFILVVGIGLLLLVSLAISVCLAALGTSVAARFPAPLPVVEAAHFVLAAAVITVLLAVTFKLLPHVAIAWRDVWLGAAATSLLLTVGKFLIGFYIGKTSVASAYGAFGSLVIIVVWVYYSAQIVLLGAEFTKAWTAWREAPTAVATTDSRLGRGSNGDGA
jgi:membrane protein